MEIDSISAVSGASRSAANSTALGKPARKISLAGIRPWTWFVIDYAIAYASATIAFILTPHSMRMISLEQDHVGQM